MPVPSMRGDEPMSETREARFTPGPWTVVPYGDGDSLVIHHDSDSRICFMATPGSRGDPAKIAADAHLIAAAPDLYEALRGLADHARPENWAEVDDENDEFEAESRAEVDAWLKADAALARAKGEG